ncbi:MAG: thymidine kinase [Nitrososphaeria archaeon]|nr:thymidine kinase [Conexivisphaerales archaeon]
MQGWIKVYTGPMFSRKTEELLIELRRYELGKKKIALFKHAIDNRYGEEYVVSHDGRKMKAFKVSDPYDIYKIGKEYEVIGIDEAQFFGSEIVEVVSKLADEGKRVVVAGLDKNFLGKPFGAMPLLLAIADEVIKLTAVCPICGEPASFTIRKSKEQQEILIGGYDQYEPRCRVHRNVL